MALAFTCGGFSCGGFLFPMPALRMAVAFSCGSFVTAFYSPCRSYEWRWLSRASLLNGIGLRRFDYVYPQQFAGTCSSKSSPLQADAGAHSNNNNTT
jgi:hypothetical protein